MLLVSCTTFQLFIHYWSRLGIHHLPFDASEGLSVRLSFCLH